MIIRDFTPRGNVCFTFLNKAVYTPFICSAKFLVDIVNQPVRNDGENQSIKDFRYDNSTEIEEKMNHAPQQKSKGILADAVHQIRSGNQKQRRLYIVIVENAVKEPRKIPDPHIQQGLKAQNAFKKQIAAEAAEKTGEKAASPSPHQSERDCQDEQQIRFDRCNFN